MSGVASAEQLWQNLISPRWRLVPPQWRYN
ncbi:MAG: hypothetical protein RLZZ247_1780, partial [Cyanobacteriota bacterium]